MSRDHVVRIGGAIVAGAMFACVWAGLAAGAPKVPDPCTLVPAGTITSTVGVSGSGKISTRPDNGVKDTLCTIVQGAARLQISVSPHHGIGGFGGPPGMVLKHIEGLGPDATYAYDLNPKYKFTDVTFSNGTFDGDVWNNGSAAPAHVLALARILYKSLPH